MKGLIPVTLDMKSLNNTDEKVERTTKDEKKAIKWLKEYKPVEIKLSLKKPFWDISNDDSE